MKTYPVQPLDLMQWINTKYHDPFIHALLEFEGGLKQLLCLQCDLYNGNGGEDLGEIIREIESFA